MSYMTVSGWMFIFSGTRVNRWCTGVLFIVAKCACAWPTTLYWFSIFHLFLSLAFMFRLSVRLMRRYFVRFNFRQSHSNIENGVRLQKVFFISILFHRHFTTLNYRKVVFVSFCVYLICFRALKLLGMETSFSIHHSHTRWIPTDISFSLLICLVFFLLVIFLVSCVCRVHLLECCIVISVCTRALSIPDTNSLHR